MKRRYEELVLPDRIELRTQSSQQLIIVVSDLIALGCVALLRGAILGSIPHYDVSCTRETRVDDRLAVEGRFPIARRLATAQKRISGTGLRCTYLSLKHLRKL
jgi:hypothetical protein